MNVNHNESEDSLSVLLTVNAISHVFIQFNKYLLSIYNELTTVLGFVAI